MNDQKKKTCGKCGSSIEKPGPCPVCEDRPFGLPKNPTTGAMRSMLEKLGIPNRGKPFTDEQLQKMLIEQGIEIDTCRRRHVDKNPEDR